MAEDNQTAEDLYPNGFGSSSFFSLQFPLQFFMCLSLSLFFLSHHHLFIFYFLFLSLHTHKTRKLERELERTKGEDPNPQAYPFVVALHHVNLLISLELQ
jgi:hypothetical protein